MSPDDIQDEKSLTAWLEGQEHTTKVWIASRVAARVFPIYGDLWVASQRDDLMAIFRCLLTSTILVNRPTANVQAVATIARAAAPEAIFAAIAAATSDRIEASSIASSTASLAANVAFVAFMSKAVSYPEVIWTNVREDTRFIAEGGDIHAPRKLWPDEIPELIDQNWQEVKTTLQQPRNDGPWGFWVAHYDALLAGKRAFLSPFWKKLLCWMINIGKQAQKQSTKKLPTLLSPMRCVNRAN